MEEQNLLNQSTTCILSNPSTGISYLLFILMGDLGKTTTTKIPVIKHAQSTLDSISFNNLIISSVAAALLSWIPFEEGADGNRVPTIIFKGQPTSFHAFVFFLMFGFSASFCALFSYNRPKMAKFFRSGSIFFLASAAAVLFYATFH